MSSDYKDLDAVHVDDFQRMLKKIGLFEKYSERQVKCKFCKINVSNSNIYSVLKEAGSYKLICDKPTCVQSLLDLVAKRKSKSVHGE